MRDISMERVNETRKNILEIIESATLTHEQKLTCLANQADSLMEVLDLPEGLDELLNVPIDRKCICDLPHMKCRLPGDTTKASPGVPT